MKNNGFRHELADVQSERIGPNTKVWQYTVILPGAEIGSDCNICSHVFIENDVSIGDRVTIKNGAKIWDGVRIRSDAFIGPNVSFTNDKYPRSRQYPESYMETTIERLASIGAGAVLCPGITVGEGAMVAAGAVVTKSVPPFSKVAGSPATVRGYVAGKSSASVTAVNSANSLHQEGVIPGVKLVRTPIVEDMRGSLTAGELLEQVPFQVARYFFVFAVPSSQIRGEHAHRECHQFLIAAHGSCRVLLDDGQQRQEVLLDSPATGLYIPPMVWGTQYDYSADAVLLVFASHHYDPDDYIRDYASYRQEV